MDNVSFNNHPVKTMTRWSYIYTVCLTSLVLDILRMFCCKWGIGEQHLLHLCGGKKGNEKWLIISSLHFRQAFHCSTFDAKVLPFVCHAFVKPYKNHMTSHIINHCLYEPGHLFTNLKTTECSLLWDLVGFVEFLHFHTWEDVIKPTFMYLWNSRVDVWVFLIKPESVPVLQLVRALMILKLRGLQWFLCKAVKHLVEIESSQIFNLFRYDSFFTC